ncbi:MAG: hypothetical protein ACI8WB_003773 [Phenylobacterium sp.]|jgi:hypothetical protein
MEPSSQEHRHDADKSDEAATNQTQSESFTEPTSGSFSAEFELHHRELDLIEIQRDKTRLFDPAGVYQFRHIALGLSQLFLHLVSLIISSVCIVAIFFIAPFSSLNEVEVIGVGMVPDISLIDYLSMLLVTIIAIRGCLALFKQTGGTGIKRYRLSMLANSMNFAVSGLIKLLVYLLVALCLFLISFGGDVEVSLLKFSNGVNSDVAYAIISLIEVFIVYHAFRFCRKEFSQ